MPSSLVQVIVELTQWPTTRSGLERSSKQLLGRTLRPAVGDDCGGETEGATAMAMVEVEVGVSIVTWEYIMEGVCAAPEKENDGEHQDSRLVSTELAKEMSDATTEKEL